MDNVSATDRTIDRTQFANSLYYVAFSLYISVSMLLNTAMQTFFDIDIVTFSRIAYVVIITLIVLKLVLCPLSPRGTAALVGALFVGYFSWQYANIDAFFWLILLIGSSKNVDFRRLVRLALAITALGFVLVVLESRLGLVDNRNYGTPELSRYAFGFSHPNTYGYYALAICLFAYSCVLDMPRMRRPVPTIASVAGIVVLQAINLSSVRSRTSFIMSLIASGLFVAFWLIRDSKTRQVLKVALFSIAGAGILFSIVAMFVYSPNNPVLVAINRVLSARISYANYYLNLRPLTLFGSSFNDATPIAVDAGAQTPVTFLVDNSYCRLLIRFGIVPTIAFFVGVAVLVVRLCRSNRWDGLVFGLVIALLYGLSEPVAMRPDWNVFLIALGTEVIFSGENFFGSPYKVGTLPSLDRLSGLISERLGDLNGLFTSTSQESPAPGAPVGSSARPVSPDRSADHANPYEQPQRSRNARHFSGR